MAFKKQNKKSSLSFSKDCRWFSEGLIPSQFLARSRGDPLAEAWTHGDGIIGHLEVGEGGRADIRLSDTGNHLVCVEAKLFSKLSAGVKNAGYFNQAARYVACMAELLKRANLLPDSMQPLGLYVVAPQSQIDSGVFGENLNHEHIQRTVKRRVDEYNGEKDEWFREWFLPTLEEIDIQYVSWESIIKIITDNDSNSGTALLQFYEKCIAYNLPKNRIKQACSE